MKDNGRSRSSAFVFDRFLAFDDDLPMVRDKVGNDKIDSKSTDKQ